MSYGRGHPFSTISFTFAVLPRLRTSVPYSLSTAFAEHLAGHRSVISIGYPGAVMSVFPLVGFHAGSCSVCHELVWRDAKWSFPSAHHQFL